MNRQPAPVAPSLADSILNQQLRHVPPPDVNNALNHNNNNNVNPINDISHGGTMSELNKVLRMKGNKAASEKAEQIKRIKDKLEEHRFYSFDEAKKFIKVFN